MKSFFATAAIAAIVSAYDAEDMVEDIMDGEDPAHAIENVLEDRAEDIEREIERFLEDVECWWADRNNGNGECAARFREQEMENCWNEGNEWDWDSNECFTREEMDAKREIECLYELGGEWIPLQEGWSPECFTGDIW